jgi:hypothetical protein
MSSPARRSGRRSAAPLSYEDSSRVVSQLTAARAQQLYQAWRDAPEADRVEQIRADLHSEADEILPALQKTNLVAVCQWLGIRATTSMNKNVLMDLIVNTSRSDESMQEQAADEESLNDDAAAGSSGIDEDVSVDHGDGAGHDEELEEKHNSSAPSSPTTTTTSPSRVTHRDLERIDHNIHSLSTMMNKSINSMNDKMKSLLQQLPTRNTATTSSNSNNTNSSSTSQLVVNDLLDTLQHVTGAPSGNNVNNSSATTSSPSRARPQSTSTTTGGGSSGAPGSRSGSGSGTKHNKKRRASAVIELDGSDDEDDHDSSSTSTLTLNRIEDSIATAILRRVPLGQSMTQYFYGIKDTLKSKRTCHEMEVLAQGLDALIDEGVVPGASIGFEVFIRRFAALQTADTTGNYAIADALSFSGHSVSLLPTTTLSAINKTLRLMKPNSSSSTNSSTRPRSSFNGRPTNRRSYAVPFSYNNSNDYSDDGLAVSFTNPTFDGGRRVHNNRDSQPRGGSNYGSRNNNYQGRRNSNNYNNNYSSNNNNSSNRATPAPAADGSSRS